MYNVDPPDLPLWPTSRRLFALWRDQWPHVTVGLLCAFAYSTLSLAIPILLQRAIDDAVVPGDTQRLGYYVTAILVLSLIRFVVNFIRRYSTSRVGIWIEAEMRERLYRAYLDFPRPFYDRHPTGQVISRATNDLFPIRYFIGWGIVRAPKAR